MVARSYSDVLRAAINDLVEHGFDSQERVDRWLKAIKEAAERTLTPEYELERQLRMVLEETYRKLIDRGGILAMHRGIERFTIERVRPALRAEVDRRIMASAGLIRLNRDQMMAKTLQRFQGWATSIPAGGTDVAKRAETRAQIAKPLGLVKFEERRVLIDQSHKMTAAISDILARDGGAIAGMWHSNWRTPHYNYREDHKERDEQIFMLRGNWALARGLVKPGPMGFYDQYTAVGEEIFCRCWMQWFYTVSALYRAAPDMLTKKGLESLEAVRKELSR